MASELGDLMRLPVFVWILVETRPAISWSNLAHVTKHIAPRVGLWHRQRKQAGRCAERRPQRELSPARDALIAPEDGAESKPFLRVARFR
jgi:hypothetical protein